MFRKLLLACVLLFTASLASGVQLLKDINAVEFWDESESSSFGEGVTVAGGTLFIISDREHGAELWITDGTAAGTRLVRDIHPGPQSSNISRMTLVAGIALFIADDGANGEELWRSDGTTAGTTLVANIGAGPTPYHPQQLDEYDPFPTVGAAVYFRAVDAAGEELWRSDGTATGTYRVSDIAAGVAGSQIRHFRVAGSRLFFLATDSAGEELWSSDGTTAGTIRVADIGTASTGGEITEMTVVADRLFFVATNLANGREIWRTTAAGAGAEVVDVNTLAEATDATRTRSSEPGGLFPLGDSVGFAARRMTGTPAVPVTEYGLFRLGPTGAPQLLMTRPNGMPPQNVIVAGNNALFRFDFLDLYVTNGTPAGTMQLGISNLYVEFDATVLQQGGVAYFFAQQNPGTGNMGYDLWRTDGTVAGTRLFANIDTSYPQQDMVWLNGRLYFTHAYYVYPNSFHEIWTSDGTTAGTVAVTGSSGLGGVGGLLVSAGRLFFTASDTDYSGDAWVTDGTASGTRKIRDLRAFNVTRDSGPEMRGALGSTVFFVADDGLHGSELWASDGTSAGTRLVRDITPGLDGTGASHMFAMTGFALFTANDGVHGWELWRTDGTEAGTTLVKDVYPGSNDSGVGLSPYQAVRSGAFVYFMAEDGVNGREVWRTDGTDAGTVRVTNFAPGDFQFGYLMPHVVNSRLFVMGLAPAGNVLFSVATNGSYFLLNTDAPPESVNGAAVFQNRLCWVGYDASFDAEIYCTDGTAGSVAAITNFNTRGLSATGGVFVVNGRLLVDVFGDPAGGGGLYASDGTIASLEKISDLHFGADGVFIAGGTRYVANVPSIASGTSPMVTDGTAAGTRLFLPAGVPPLVQPYPGYSVFGVFEDQLVFSVRHPDTGHAVWKSDGTAGGTRFVADVNPSYENQGAAPDGFFQNGSRLFFSAYRERIGNELWMLAAANPNGSDDFAETNYNTAVVVDVLANDAVFAGSLSGASVVIANAPASGTTSINSATGAITYTPNAGFAGLDTFTYRVGDGLGNASNIAYVQVITHAQVSGTAPGTAPVPPPTTPPVTPPTTPPTTPPSSGGGGGGGGGAWGAELLLLAMLLPLTRRRVARVPR